MTIIKTAQLPKLTSGSGPGPVFHKFLTPAADPGPNEK